jgi:predicted dehydrogenase
MKAYRAAVIGCSRMGGFIDNEMVGAPGHVPPYSHGAGFTACERTDLVACCDLRPEVMAEFGRRYDVPTERQYADYRELIARERPEIVSVATQPEQRAEIVVFAAGHGTRAIYAEKAMAASLADADAMVEAVERNGVAFDLGTNRRWHPGFERMKEVIHGGELGELRSLIAYSTGALFNMGSHAFDTLLWLNDDRPAAWVQAHLPRGARIEGEVLREDPVGEGIIGFADGVTAYALTTPRGSEYEAVCQRGTVASRNNEVQWQMRRAGPRGHPENPRACLAEVPFPDFVPASTTLRLIEDLVHALDTGEPPRGGIRAARANMELIFAFIESHRRGGARVELPLRECPLRLQREWSPRQPRLSP